MKAAHDLGHPKADSPEKAIAWAAKIGMSPKTLQTIFAAYWSTHEVGVVMAETQEQAIKVFDDIEPAISELEALLHLRKPQAALVLRGVMNNLRAWLLRNSH